MVATVAVANRYHLTERNMMTARKTVKLTDVVTKANRMLAYSADEHTDGRRMLEVFVSGLLIDADAYAGYRLTDGDDPTRIAYFPPKVPVGTVVR